MDKFFYYNDLFSIYRELLTENEKKIFSYYYEENLSMGEISSNVGVSRSAIGNTIKTVEKKLDYYEGVLKLCYKRKQILEILSTPNYKVLKEQIESIIHG